MKDRGDLKVVQGQIVETVTICLRAMYGGFLCDWPGVHE